ncbi:MAG TPA: SGNH/GDSL hydrolase family protein, partial [bacterium]|nr:SGNH/GDSL hydrolase family protein [bacterium]
AIAAGTLVLTAGFKTTEWIARTGAGKADRFNAPAMILLLAASVGFEQAAGVPVAVRELARDVRVPGLNRQDQEMMQRGYYEKLTKVNRFNSQLWEVYAGQGRAAPPEIRRPTGDFQGLENIPLLGVTYKGQPLRTNRWGMRDKDYEKEPPPDTFRIALMGASYVMGSGVGDGETFEWVLEDRLNAEADSAGTERVEILNFAVGTLSSAQQLFLLRKSVLEFQPDAVMLVCPATDADLFARLLFRTREEGVEIPYPFLRDLVDSLGVTAGTDEDEAIRRLQPVRGRLVQWVYREFADECRAHDIEPLWVFLTLPGRTPEPALIDEQIEAATAAGFTVFDLRNVYHGYDPKALQVAPWDWHPNPVGHRVIAERLERRLKERGVLPGSGAG